MCVFVCLFVCFLWRVGGGGGQGALAIRRIFSLVDIITKSKCHNVFKIGVFR